MLQNDIYKVKLLKLKILMLGDVLICENVRLIGFELLNHYIT